MSRRVIHIVFLVMLVGLILTSQLQPVTAQIKATFTVDDFGNALDANPGDGICATAGGKCNIRAAVQEANALAGEDTIYIPAGTFEIQPVVYIETNITIIGEGQTQTILKLNQTTFSHLFQVDAGAEFTLQNVTIQNTGGIYNKGIFNVSNSKFLDNKNETGGGGAIENGRILGVYNCTFTGNQASISGGAIHNIGFVGSGNFANITMSTFIDNLAPLGGAIDVVGGFMELHVNYSTFASNSATNGGAIMINGSKDNIVTDSSIFNNSAEDYGGGIFIGSPTASSQGVLTIERSSITGNVSLKGGGGIFVGDLPNQASPHELTIINSTLSGNESKIHGGGILANERAFVKLFSSTLSLNIADRNGISGGQGGGIYILNDPDISYIHTHFENSVIAENKDLSTGTLPLFAEDCYGNFNTGGMNLFGILRPGVCNLTIITGSNLSGTLSAPLDPKLGGLENGAYNLYHMPLANSPVVDMGDLNGCKDPAGALLSYDQRGEARKFGFACDLGAIESSFRGSRIFLPIVRR
jgi:hypothetical protein